MASWDPDLLHDFNLFCHPDLCVRNRRPPSLNEKIPLLVQTDLDRSICRSTPVSPVILFGSISLPDGVYTPVRFTPAGRDLGNEPRRGCYSRPHRGNFRAACATLRLWTL